MTKVKELHNVSVRLDENDFKKLEAIKGKFDSKSYSKVSYADVVRVAINELYDKEFLLEDDSEEPAE